MRFSQINIKISYIFHDATISGKYRRRMNIAPHLGGISPQVHLNVPHQKPLINVNDNEERDILIEKIGRQQA